MDVALDAPRLVFFFCFIMNADAGSHSLWALSTFIVEDTQFPEFSVVVMLDDVQIMYYNSNFKNFFYRASASELSASEQNIANIVAQHQHKSMKYRALESKTHHNLTRGINVQQRIAGCELMDSSSSSPVLSWDAFNGEPVEELTFNKHLNTMESHGLWPSTWNQIELIDVQSLYANLYHPLCIKTLKHYLSKEKNRVIRKVKPRVRLVSKDGGTRVSCLATGFYPRHINLTLSRDGQPVDEEQTTGGELLPNADGTYQMRKTLDVTPEDLKESHKFTCTATHLSLDNKLDVSLDYVPPVGTGPLAYSLVTLVILGFVLVTVLVWKLCKRGVSSCCRSPPHEVRNLQ